MKWNFHIGMSDFWNPWHGCHKISDGCLNCYVYRIDSKFGRNPSLVTKSKAFNAPLKRDKSGNFSMSGSVIYTCFSSDFFVEEADAWRPEAWKIMKIRDSQKFLFITKRIHRFMECIPEDWGDGYPNVSIGCTMESQKMADYRMPIFLEAPIVHKFVVCEPLLGPIDFHGALNSGRIEEVIVGGESGENARICEFDWVMQIREQCLESKTNFHFKQTGAKFKKDGRLYKIPRRLQSEQAAKSKTDLCF